MRTRGKKPRVLISACLLGQKLRYDGTHARDAQLRKVLGRHVEWVPICPETECGLSVPREPMRLRGDPDSPRIVTVGTNRDQTERMRRWAERRLRELADAGLCGFVFKSGSPSCGPSGVKVFALNGAPPRSYGTGLFAGAVQRRFPLLPAIDEVGMKDPRVREAFMERLFASMRWRDFLENGPTLGGLAEFHSAHELLIYAHDPKTAAGLERLIRGAGRVNRLKLFERYGALFMSALKTAATPIKNARALKAVFSRLKDGISEEGAAPLLSVIEDYKMGHVPLLVPLALLRHYVERVNDHGLKRQLFLNPYPPDLG
jgi:uncharacterized protein YbbK (DUF523 family)/uncharacterized protein YbgA (DUF1722 family)